MGTLFNSNTATGFLQISSAQPAPNSDEEKELDAAFLSEGVHVNVNSDGVDDVEELPTPSEAQSQRQAEKRPAEPSHSSGKRKKGHSLESMTEAIWGFTDMRNHRGKKSTDTVMQCGRVEAESVTHNYYNSSTKPKFYKNTRLAGKIIEKTSLTNFY